MSQETHIATATIGDKIYEGYFNGCFSSLWKANHTVDASWTNALRTCIQKHIDVFTIVSNVHENKPSFTIPSFAAGEDEDEDEDDE